MANWIWACGSVLSSLGVWLIQSPSQANAATTATAESETLSSISSIDIGIFVVIALIVFIAVFLLFRRYVNGHKHRTVNTKVAEEIQQNPMNVSNHNYYRDSSLAVIHEDISRKDEGHNNNDIHGHDMNDFAAVIHRKRRPSARRVWDSESSDDNGVAPHHIQLDKTLLWRKQQRFKRWDADNSRDRGRGMEMEMGMVQSGSMSDGSVHIGKERVGVVDDVNEDFDSSPTYKNV